MNHSNLRSYSSLSYIPGLDGLRALSVIAVMLLHFTVPFIAAFKQLSDGWEIWARFASVGWVGVDVFFVLSGFLIAKILTKKPISDFSDYRAFITRRAWRLLPVYITALLVFTIAALLIKPHSEVLRYSWLDWTLLSNVAVRLDNVGRVLGDDTFSLVHLWSLAAEWHFYLLLPLLLRATKSVEKTSLLLIATALATRFAFYFFDVSYNHSYTFTLCRIDSFAFGCLLATPWTARLKDKSRFIALAGAAIFLTVMFGAASSDILFRKLVWMRTCGYSLIALSVSMMLIGILNAPATWLPMRILESRLLTTIGRSSYSIYVWHLIFFPLIRNFVHRHVGEVRLEYFAVLTAELAASAVLGTLSYRLIETRFAALRPSNARLMPRMSS